ncbi:MAG: hypothetical protein WCT40_00965 [Candidatus Magasanikbacteria bacterium]|jgi:hypothetical protein
MSTLPGTPKSENWRLALKFLNQCPVCSAPYREGEAKLSAQKNQVHLVHITCHACGGYFITMVMQMGAGISSVGTVTDLNHQDVQRVMSLPPLTLNEVLDAHQFIQQFEF